MILLCGVGVGAAAGGTKTKAVAGPTQSFTMTKVTLATVTATTTPTQVISTQQVTTTVTFTPAPVNQFTDGTQAVGADIPAGTYKTNGQGRLGNCYYAILNSTNNNDIASNDNFDGPTTVKLTAGKYFQTSGGCSWAKIG